MNNRRYYAMLDPAPELPSALIFKPPAGKNKSRIFLGRILTLPQFVAVALRPTFHLAGFTLSVIAKWGSG